MPGLPQRCAQFGHAPATACSAFSAAAAGSLPASNAIWSRQRDDVGLDQMQKFWTELPIEVRRELLRIDKPTFCELARKNLYCSRCHGLLLECYSQILVYGKTMQQEFYGRCCTRKTTEVFAVDESDNLQDPSVHPWGGLATTKDGILTLLDCFICASSLDVLHKVFDSSRQREHDRELLYPDACGGGGRGWINQGLVNYGRGHGAREACALHTSRLSCDTLVDFWSALADETRLSLLHMKEDDFIERLMYRFDSKRFCRDCRRNVLREFKELKELKRLRKELYCSSWFCVADTAIRYEVSVDSVVVDWRHSFEDTSTYHHFEWGIGTEDGKTDILDFEDVGMNGKVHVNGLDLSNLSACFITLRAWKLDGRCTELCVKAHALKGQACVHQRLIVGDGFVSITKGNSIKNFFEHAEEVEEEDDDSVDKDGTELGGDGSRPQKHAKSPELAREFLLDAATVIFKEQVEKAFREGTARQNAHSLFVSLAIKLLEERVHVACKEIITLEKQIKLLEEEENEKREEEERRERRRNKEREKKLRRKERLKEKEKDREIKLVESKPLSFDRSTSTNNSSTRINDDSATSIHNSSESVRNNNTLSEPVFTNLTDDNSSNGYVDAQNLQDDRPYRQDYADEFRESIGSFIPKQSKSSRRKLTFERATPEDQAPRHYDKHRSTFSSEMGIQHVSSMKLKVSSRSLIGGPRSFKERVARLNFRNCIDARFSEKFHSSKTFDYQSCPSNQPGEYRVKDRYHISTIRVGREVKSINAADSSGDWPRQRPRYSKHNHGVTDNCFIPKGGRDVIHTRQVWEPLNVRKKYNENNLGSDATLSIAAKIHPSEEISYDKDEKGCLRNDTSAEVCSSELSRNTGKANSISCCDSHPDGSKDLSKSDLRTLSRCENGFLSSEGPLCCSKDIAEGHCQSSIMSTFSMSNRCRSVVSSSSDSCSSCPSEGDNSTNLSSTLNVETSSTSDSEYPSQQFYGRDFSSCNGDALPKSQNNPLDSKFEARGVASHNVTTLLPSGSCTGASFQRKESRKVSYNSAGGLSKVDDSLPQQNMLQVHNNLTMPASPLEIMGYENQNAFAWSATAVNGLLPFSQHSPYMFPPPVGYGLPANRSSDLRMQCNTMQPPMTAAVFNLQQHHLYHANSRDCRVFPTSPKVQVRNDNVHREEQVIKVPEPRERSSESKEHPLKEGTSKSSSKDHEGNQSFSLFHFGGPLAGAAAYGVKREYATEHTGHTLKSVESQDSIACSMENTKIEEYSLFSTGNSSKFLFSTFTL